MSTFTPFICLSLVGFLSAAPAQHHGGADAKAAPATADAAWTLPYTLDTCPISGKKLGSMGDPVVRKYEGREVRFCCEGCIGRFEADPIAAWRKIDEAIIKDQMRYYPLETCVVSGEPLIEEGKDIATNAVYGNRLVRLCCGACERELRKDPAKYIAKLDKSAADAQRKDYPLETCVVSTGALGSMGEPSEIVVAGRLMRFCCAGCEPKVRKDPVKYLHAIDSSWQAKGRFQPASKDSKPHEGVDSPGHGTPGGDHGHHGSGNGRQGGVHSGQTGAGRRGC